MIQVPIDIPNTCYECPFNIGEYSPEFYEKRYCDITGKSMSKRNYKARPSVCPLKEIKNDIVRDNQ